MLLGSGEVQGRGLGWRVNHYITGQSPIQGSQMQGWRGNGRNQALIIEREKGLREHMGIGPVSVRSFFQMSINFTGDGL